jgi:hypothetical protein
MGAKLVDLHFARRFFALFVAGRGELGAGIDEAGSLRNSGSCAALVSSLVISQAIGSTSTSMASTRSRDDAVRARP